MKAFRIILVSFLFITACQLQKVKKPDDQKEQSPNAADSQASDFKNTPKHLTLGITQIPAIVLSDHLSGTETAIQKPDSKGIFRIESGNRRIVVPATDASSRKLISRTIPGIEWIEQRIDNRTILKINFENDLITYANTDKYFYQWYFIRSAGRMACSIFVSKTDDPIQTQRLFILQSQYGSEYVHANRYEGGS